MAVTVDDIKLSLRIDVTEDDPMIKSYLDAAEDYVQTAVSKNEDLTIYKQYDFCRVLADTILVSKQSNWYDKDTVSSCQYDSTTAWKNWSLGLTYEMIGTRIYCCNLS